MLNSDGFNEWSKDYDRSVEACEKEDSYPFAGYTEVLSKIEQIVLSKEKPSVLDLGFGTAVLTEKLYQRGCRITGVDFSQSMIQEAKRKMPQANLILGDFTSGIPKDLHKMRYDFILGTYSIHHVQKQNQLAFLRSLSGYLAEGGKILIGDVMFQSQREYDLCHEKCASQWDEDEVYPVFERLEPPLSEFGLSVCFQQISFCSGILSIQKRV